MPKLYEYFGLIIFFYSNEHEPIHVHGQYQGHESKAEFIIVEGQIVEIRFKSIKGKKPLKRKQFEDFQAVVEQHAEEIVQKWIEYFILHRRIPSKTITQSLR